jgi:hypothetical protein
MSKVLALVAALLLLFPLSGAAQDGRATIEAASKALGADDLKTISAEGAAPDPGRRLYPRAAERAGAHDHQSAEREPGR